MNSPTDALTPAASRRERDLRWAVVLTLLLTYTYVLPRWGDSNENSRLNLVLAVVREHRIITDTFAADTRDRAFFRGHYYSEKSIGTALLALAPVAALEGVMDTPPGQRVLRPLEHAAQFLTKPGHGGMETDTIRYYLDLVAATDLCVALPSALTVGLMFGFLRRWLPSPGARALLTLAYGLGTPAVAYSGVFYGHQLAACILFLVFTLLWVPTLSPRRLAAVGLLLGASVPMEFSSAILVPFFLLYLWLRLGKRLRPMAPLLWLTVPALLQLGYNGAAFGSPFATGYRYTDFAKTTPAGFVFPTPHMIWGVTFSPFRGIFFRAPWLLLAVPGFVLWWRSRQMRLEWALSVAVILALLAYNVCYQVWWGGYAVGPRHFMTALPFFVPAVAVFWRWAARPLRAAAGALMALSVALCVGESWAGPWFPPDDKPGTTWLTWTIPHWRSGDLARNLGSIAGLHGVRSLLPLLLLIACVWAFTWLQQRP